MKTIKLFSIALCCTLFATAVAAQKTQTETFAVNGNCGMCENTIEKAAKAAGASFAEWDKDKKVITVKFNSTTSDLAKIQKNIASAGYDNAGGTATKEAYDKLHSCCKYERAASTDKTPAHAEMDGDCCKDGKCSMPGHNGKDCCKGDKGSKGSKGSKDGDAVMDCCKDGKCTMPGHDGKDCCKGDKGSKGNKGSKDGDAVMDCCKDGKCTKEGHDGKDCCVKEMHQE